MTSLLPPPTQPASRITAPSATAPQHQAIGRAVDRTMHAASLLLRTAAYSTAAAAISGAPFGPSFLFGVLLGDLAGSLAQSRTAVKTAPVSAMAQIALLTGFTAFGWSQVGWPANSELRALLMLGAFASFAARIGWAFGGRDDRTL